MSQKNYCDDLSILNSIINSINSHKELICSPVDQPRNNNCSYSSDNRQVLILQSAKYFHLRISVWTESLLFHTQQKYLWDKLTLSFGMCVRTSTLIFLSNKIQSLIRILIGFRKIMSPKYSKSTHSRMWKWKYSTDEGQTKHTKNCRNFVHKWP